MAVEAKNFIADILKRLPSDHADRGILEENFKSLSEYLSESEVNKIRSLYEKRVHTYKLITEVWRRFWNWRMEKKLVEIYVPPCDRSSEEIRELEEEGRMLIYVPPVFSASEGLRRLNDFFVSYEAAGLPKAEDIINNHEQHGWLDVEKSLRAPHIGKGEATIALLESERGWKVQTLNTYIIGSEFSQLVSGHCFDEGTYSMVASRSEGENLLVRQQVFESGESYFFIAFQEKDRSYYYDSLVGVRFAGKKAS